MIKFAHLFLVATCLVASTIQATTDDDLYQEVFNYTAPELTETDKFDWDIFKIFAKERDGNNVLLSPISLKIALQILYEAAAGETERQIFAAFGGQLTKEQNRAKYAKILDSMLKTSKEYELKVGSRMYIDSSISARQKYESLIANSFKCQIKPLQSKNSASIVDEINRWVSELTKGNIQTLVDREDIENSVILLLNTVYFHGSWQNQFMTNKTAKGGFHLNAYDQTEVPYMSQTNKFMFHHSDALEAKLIKMPYQGDKYSMYIVLPDSINGLGTVVANINPGVLKRAIALMEDTNVKLVVPKFKFNHHATLVQALELLGVRDIFTTNASLPLIARGKGVPIQLRVSNIVQKSGVDVNELGTVAYSATEVQLVNKFGDDDYVEDFKVSRPFMFLIEDSETSQILFIGKVENPLSPGAPPSNAPTATAAPSKNRPK